jgi:chromosome segregation ATPase
MRELKPTVSRPATQNELRRAVNSVEVLIQQFELLTKNVSVLEAKIVDYVDSTPDTVEAPKDFSGDISSILSQLKEVKTALSNGDKKVAILEKKVKVLEDLKTDKLETRLSAVEKQLKDLNK